MNPTAYTTLPTFWFEPDRGFLANLLRQIAAAPQMIAPRAEAAYQAAQAYTWDAIAAQIEARIQALCQSLTPPYREQPTASLRLSPPRWELPVAMDVAACEPFVLPHLQVPPEPFRVLCLSRWSSCMWQMVLAAVVPLRQQGMALEVLLSPLEASLAEVQQGLTHWAQLFPQRADLPPIRLVPPPRADQPAAWRAVLSRASCLVDPDPGASGVAHAWAQAHGLRVISAGHRDHLQAPWGEVVGPQDVRRLSWILSQWSQDSRLAYDGLAVRAHLLDRMGLTSQPECAQDPP